MSQKANDNVLHSNHDSRSIFVALAVRKNRPLRQRKYWWVERLAINFCVTALAFGVADKTSLERNPAVLGEDMTRMVNSENISVQQRDRACKL